MVHESRLRRAAFAGALFASALVATGASAANEAPPSPGAYDAADAPPKGAMSVPLVPGHFLTNDGGWARFAFPPNARDRVEPLARGVDELRAKLTSALGRVVPERLEVRVARDDEALAELAPAGMAPKPGASGAAYPELGLVVVALATTSPAVSVDAAEVLGHEIAHVALHEATRGRRLPGWFAEGFAAHAADGHGLAHSAKMIAATFTASLLPLGELADEADAPGTARTEAADFVRYLLAPTRRGRFATFVRSHADGASLDDALTSAYGGDLAALERAFRADVRLRYGYGPALIALGVAATLAALVASARRTARLRLEAERREADDARREALAARASRKRARAEARDGDPRDRAVRVRGLSNDPGVPRIEVEGRWHTLH